MAFSALIYKNWLLIRRAPCSFICTILLCLVSVLIVLDISLFALYAIKESERNVTSLAIQVAPSSYKLGFTISTRDSMWTSVRNIWGQYFGDNTLALRFRLPPGLPSGVRSHLQRLSQDLFYRFYRFGDGYRPSMSWDEKTFAALIDFSKRDEDVRHLLETVFLVTSESEDQLERSCQEIGANRLAADRALYRRLNESDAKLTQVAPLLLPLYGTNGTNVTEATRRLMSDIENELRGENVNFGIDPGVLLNSEFTCLAVIFDQFDPIAHRVKYTIRQEFDEMLQPSGRSWFMDLGTFDFLTTPCVADDTTCAHLKLRNSYFLQLQVFTEELIVRVLTNNSNFTYPRVQSVVCPSAKTRVVWPLLVIDWLLSFAPASYLLLPGAIATRLVSEKETKMKLLLLVFGMSPHAFWLSWLAFYGIIMGVISALLTVAYWPLLSFGGFLAVALFFAACLLHSLAIFGLGFALSGLFSSSTRASVVTHLLSLTLFVCFFIFDAITRTGTLIEIPLPVFYLFCLIEPFCFNFVLQRLIVAIIIYTNNIFKQPYPEQPTLAGLFLLLTFDAILYLIIGIFSELIFSEGYGDLWGFSCLKEFFRRRFRKSATLNEGEEYGLLKEEEAVDPDDIETPIGKQPAIEIAGLCKVFSGDRIGGPRVKAVRGLSLHLFGDEITCLLGPNGAGKSTSISMLMGILKPSAGRISILGLDMSRHLDRQNLRKQMGFCLQENVYYEDLTLNDHLEFIGRLRDIPPAARTQQISSILGELDLLASKDQRANALSGGQKRRLAVSMCLLGEPRVCVLDEPTTGVDPMTRRRIWTALKARRAGRVIVFTTHFMDEADLLADRKAIMTSGQLRCVGSSLFLKTRFGLGYKLSFAMKEDPETTVPKDVEGLVSLVRRHVPDAEVERTPNTVELTLPYRHTAQFGALFQSLEAFDPSTGLSAVERFGARSFGIAMTTLEQVFLRLAHETHHQSADSANRAVPNAVLASTQHRTSQAMDLRVFPDQQESAGMLSATNPLSTVDEEDTNTAALSSANAPPASQPAPLRQLERKVSILKRLSSRPESVGPSAPTAEERPEEAAARALASHLMAQNFGKIAFHVKIWLLLRVFSLQSIRNRGTLIGRLLVLLFFLTPTLTIGIGLSAPANLNRKPIVFNPYHYLLTKGGSKVFKGDYNPTTAIGPLYLTLSSGVPHELANTYLSKILPSLGFNLSSRIFNYSKPTRKPESSSDNYQYRYSYDNEYETRDLTQNFVCGSKSSGDIESSYIKLGLNKSDSNEEILTLGYAFEGRLVLPAAVNLLTNAILRRQLLNQSISLEADTDAMHVEMSAHVFPYSSTKHIFKTAVSRVVSLLLFFPLAMFAAVGTMYILSFAATEIVSERTSGVMQLLRMSGIGMMDYWIARFLFDLCTYFIVVFILFGSLFLPFLSVYFELDALIGVAPKMMLIVSLVLYAPQLLGFIYSTSFLFKRTGFALLFYFLVFAIVPILLATTLLVIESIQLIYTLNSRSSSEPERRVFNTLTAIEGASYFFGYYLFPPYGIISSSRVIQKSILSTISTVETTLKSGSSVATNFSTLIHFTPLKIWDLNLFWSFTGALVHIIAFVAILTALHDRFFFAYRPAILCRLLPFCRRRADTPSVEPIALGNVATANATQNLLMRDPNVASEENEIENEALTVDTSPITLRQCHKRYTCCECCSKTCLCSNGPPTSWPLTPKYALRGVSLRLRPNELLGLLGPNGAGKTTAMKLIVGDERASAGQVYLCGRNLESVGATGFVKRLSYCPQEDTMYPRLAVADQLEIFARLRGADAATAKNLVSEALRALRIEEFSARRFESLSGGTKRKVVFLQSLLGGTGAVLFDEPTSGIDPESRRLIWTIMRTLIECQPQPQPAESSGAQLSRSGILTTHSLEEAEALCSRVAIIIAGRISALGTIPELKERLQAGYVLELVLSSPSQPPPLAWIYAHWPSAQIVEQFEGYLQMRLPKGNVPSLAQAFNVLETERVAQGVGEYSLGQVTLEQLFIDIVKALEGAASSGGTPFVPLQLQPPPYAIAIMQAPV